MARAGVTVYLPRALEERLERMARERNRSLSSLIAEAVSARFDQPTLDTAARDQRQRFRTDARLDKAIGEALIIKEVLLLFVRVWLEHNPPIDEELEESCAASAEARFERFLDYVVQGLSPGSSIASRELITPPLGPSPDGARIHTEPQAPGTQDQAEQSAQWNAGDDRRSEGQR